MGDESWIYSYDPETKATILAVEEPTITKSQKGVVRQVWSSTKSILIVFFE
jgi:hypothetical protein